VNDQFDRFSLVAVIVISVALVKIFRPIVAAIAHRLRGAAVSPDAELLAEIDGLKDRLAEVEERLDFSERLLAQGHQADPLPGRLQQ
jgi:hypothetical protein